VKVYKYIELIAQLGDSKNAYIKEECFSLK